MIGVLQDYPKSENENSIVKFSRETFIGVRIVVKDVDFETQVILQTEHLTPYDHSSNGLEESGVQQVTADAEAVPREQAQEAHPKCASHPPVITYRTLTLIRLLNSLEFANS